VFQYFDVDYLSTFISWKNRQPISQQSRQGGQIVSLQKGKLPPQALDLEEAVLGAMMIDKKGVDTVIDILSPAGVSISKHTNIFFRPLFICSLTPVQSIC